MQQQQARNGGIPSRNTTRIPLSLQAVFLNGNRGVVVNAPPPEKAASKTFRGFWRRRLVSSDSGITQQSTDESVDAESLGEKKGTATAEPKKKKKKKKVSALVAIHIHAPTIGNVYSPNLKFPFFSSSRHLYQHCLRNNI
jgi:hypothetical protein